MNNPIKILDGGLGQELIKRGVRGDEALWSSYALMANPEVVQQIHEAYIQVGADIITTNTYCATHARFERFDLTHRFVELNELACQLAQQARANQKRANPNGPDVLIAGSLPPYYGTYRPERVRPFEELLPIYEEQARVIAPHVDLLLCETLSTADEARAAATAALGTGLPTYVSWTLADEGADHLRSGETLEEAFDALAGLEIDAYLINCCAPESISAAMSKLASLTDKPVGGYANGFEAIPEDWLEESSTDLLGQRKDLDPAAYVGYVEKWVASGATIVGGCCEVGPEHIAEIKKMVDGALVG